MKKLITIFAVILMMSCSSDDNTVTQAQEIDCWRCKVRKIGSNTSGYNMTVCNTDGYLARFKSKKIKEGNIIDCKKLLE